MDVGSDPITHVKYEDVGSEPFTPVKYEDVGSEPITPVKYEEVGSEPTASPKNEDLGLYDLGQFYQLYDRETEMSVDQKLTEACNQIIFPEESIFQKNLYDSLKSLANSLGVPFVYISQPLLAIAANLMNCSLVVAKEPQTEGDKGHVEPVIINTLTLGNKSTNKSAAFKIFQESLAEIEKKDIQEAELLFKEENEKDEQGAEDDGPKSAKRPRKKFNANLHRRFLKKTTEGGLVSLLTTEDSNKNIVLMYEEFYIFSNLIDFSNTKNTFLPIFLESYGGSSIRCVTQPRGLEEADSPFIQFMVYAQPAVFIRELSKNPDDPSGAWERMLIVNPKRLIVDLEECHQTKLSSKSDISTILLKIREAHRQSGIKFKFDADGKKFLYEVDRDMKERMRKNADDSEFCGMLGKDIQKIIRVSAIFCELRKVAMALNPSFADASDLIDQCVNKAVGGSDTKVSVDPEMIDQLNDDIFEAVRTENFKLACELKEERDSLLHQEFSHSVDEEIDSSRFTIQKVDVMSALMYVKHCSAISIQMKEGARDLDQKRCGMGSPLKVPTPKIRNKSYWADDFPDTDKPFDFVMCHSDKYIRMFEFATNGEISMQLVRTKRCFPQPSSAKPRGVEVEKKLSLYFVKILIRHGLLDRLTDDETKVFLPRATEITEEVETKITAIKKKHHTFKPFD